MNEQKNQVSLTSFMKKQISEKSSKKNAPSKIANSSAQQKNNKNGENSENQEEMTEEEQLQEAKKASRGKAAQQDQSEMIKKLIIESIVKYTALISALVIFAIAIIKCAPIIAQFFSGLLLKIIVGGLGK